jgi:hypothetical protein
MEKEVKDNKDNEKEGKLEFEIPIVPLIVGGVLLIGFFVFLFWGEDIKITAGIIFGDELAEYKKECKNQCEVENKELYCCNPKGIYIDGKNEVYTCQDEELEVNCKLNCKNVCFNLCIDITDMMGCANAGCSWVVGDYEETGGQGGYCFPKKGTV